MATKKRSVTIVGAGLAGVFFSIILAKRGYEVELYERYSEKEILDNSSRRSFNITFFGYGVIALKEMGLWDDIKPIMLRLKGSATQLTPHGDYTIESVNDKELPYYAVSRAGLLHELVKVAKKQKNIKMHFSTKLVTIDRHARTMTVSDKRGVQKTVKCDVIIGTDGVNSLVRACIQMGQNTKHRQIFTDWTYKQIAFTPETVKKLGLQHDLPYSWTRRYASIIGFPQVDGIFGSLLMLPKNKEQGFARLNSPEAIKKFVEEQFPILMPALDEITDSILNNPEGYFVTIRTSPWYYKDFMAVVGDAAHGFLPFYGMGASTAFGDCMVLLRLMEEHGDNWSEIFRLYQEERKKNTDIIGELSYQSLMRFTRFSRADYSAIFDKLEVVLSEKLPKFFLPPMFHLVARDPNHSHEWYRKHEKQRKVTKFLGFSLAVAAVTGAVAIKEKISERFRKD